ncbi:nucleolar GTP-binding protein 2-like [Anneissia japonica]|uniref:nucleolar GTP-binding protein 2-like n=1 Tax=Anneissia japonica TaxID=1529436 RepID=UPI0014257584|nr:nucleolar GTP-binding protein 2-like [Anneissia japonica]
MAKTTLQKKNINRIKKSNSSTNPDREKGCGGRNMRDKATIRRLNMYRGGKAQRNRQGKIVKAAAFQSALKSGTVARVEPNRRWFGNTRVITQGALQNFQEELGKVLKDPYKVVMRPTQLPVTLLQERAKQSRVHLLDTQSFENTFGPKKQRKRVNMKFSDMSEMVTSVNKSVEDYNQEKDKDLEKEDDDGTKDEVRDWVFGAGQSKRIWSELYKVVDSSDVLIQVLDARDPMGTRSPHIENYLKKEKPFKHLIFILNKVDLVPTWVTKHWVAVLSSECPTLAFHASVKNPFGKGALIQLLRQFSKLHIDKKQISVGFIGYPNVGKSSIINTLRSKKVCKVAPIAGETKVWQYITLMRRIYLIDCPGTVHPTGDTETEIILKGVVRVENVKFPEEHIPEVLRRVKTEYITKTYRITQWTDHIDFLEQLARRYGKLLKGGEPDISTVAKMVLNDWQRGKIPFYVRPPPSDGKTEPTSSRAENVIKKMDKGKSPKFIEFVKGKETTVETNVEKQSTGIEEIEKRPNKKKSKEVAGVVQDLSQIQVGPKFNEDDATPDMETDDVETNDNDMEHKCENSSNTEEIKVSDRTKIKSTELKGKKKKGRKVKAAVDISLSEFQGRDTRKKEGGVLEGVSAFLSNKNQEEMELLKQVKQGRNEIEESQEPVQEMRNSKKRKHNNADDDDDDDNESHLTSKQRRSLERQKKEKKTGTHFYKVTNVKNKSKRNKKN